MKNGSSITSIIETLKDIRDNKADYTIPVDRLGDMMAEMVAERPQPPQTGIPAGDRATSTACLPRLTSAAQTTPSNPKPASA